MARRDKNSRYGPGGYPRFPLSNGNSTNFSKTSVKSKNSEYDNIKTAVEEMKKHFNLAKKSDRKASYEAAQKKITDLYSIINDYASNHNLILEKNSLTSSINTKQKISFFNDDVTILQEILTALEIKTELEEKIRSTK